MKILGKTLNRKQEKQLQNGIRICIQILFFILMPSVFTSAFSGVKYIFTAIGLHNIVELNAFVKVLIGILLYTIVFGRFFCGYACAFGSIGDWLRRICKAICGKLKKKPITIAPRVGAVLRYLKYLILIAIVCSCFGGAYKATTGYSPWDVFSMLRSGNLKLSGYILGTVILGLILIGMCLEDRFFCRFLCPMGAVFSILPILPLFTITKNSDNCLNGCNGCHRNCIAGVQPADRSNYKIEGECLQCGQCVGNCPKKNIRTSVRGIKGNEFWFVLLRALLLFLLMTVLGI